jgi:hypothetical protein
MLALIDLARLNLDQLITAQNTQALINKLDGASNFLSGKIFQYWSQNKNLSIRFDIRPALAGDPEGMREGMNLWGFVYDTAHLVQIRLGTRSRGFIWFFSFLSWFSQVRKSGGPLILLLDEPGLFLHASAQGDLLRYIEKELKPYHQVIFTTHSPFMIDPRHFERVRIVRDKTMEIRKQDEPLPEDQEGTKVLSDVLQADEGSIFPLQGALAYDITQTLFVGPNSLIVDLWGRRTRRWNRKWRWRGARCTPIFWSRAACTKSNQLQEEAVRDRPLCEGVRERTSIPKGRRHRLGHRPVQGRSGAGEACCLGSRTI